MKDKILVITFIAYISIFAILHLIIPDQEISNIERRKLSNLPEITELNSSEYITKLDKYLLDHFPLRQDFRSLKANFNYHILHKYDNNKIYLQDNYIFKSEYPTNKKSISNFINKTNEIKNLLTHDNNTYLMIIPDKNYYLNDSNFLQIDYNYLKEELNNLEIKNINIFDVLTSNDYYETDTHWKQENLSKVIKEMSSVMNFKYHETKYNHNTYNQFYGVYYGESAISRQPETITYLTNDIISNAEVKYLETNNLNKVYNEAKLNSLDPYEIYLDGASSFIEITNHNSTSKKELIIFRDSFASSLSPLLIEYYDKITIIDNRYISSEYFKEYITFTNQDILFMYSTLLINNSITLKG